MPKDYFEVVEEPEEVVSESERQAKVIEFVYQVGTGFLSFFILTDIPPPTSQVTRKICDIGEYTGWLQDGK